MTGKRLSCVLKPHVSYKKIPKTCLKICKNIAHRRKTHKHKTNKTVAFNTEPPANPNVATEEPPMEQLDNEVKPDNAEEHPENMTEEEAPTNVNGPTEENPPVNATEEEPPKETGIMSSITNTASNLLGLSNPPADNNNVKGGKNSKKRKSNNKRNKTNKRKNKLKR